MVGMDRDLQTIMVRDNPWLRGRDPHAWLIGHLPERYIERSLVERAGRAWRQSGKAHLVIGPRQAGKTTALWAHLGRIDDPVLYVDCEEGLAGQWCRSAALFLDDVEELVGRSVPLFFDEVQHLDEAALFIKGVVDRKPGVPVLVTGSSSFHLGSGTRDSLAGRATRWRLLPLSLSEVTSEVTGGRMMRRRMVEERFAKHAVIGGYPEVWLSDDPQTLLTELVNAIILRDASDLHRIRRPDAFKRLLRLMASQVGSPVNLSEWASVLGIGRDTVASYLEILESDHVAVQLPPFAGGRRSEITSQHKVYLVDCGLRNQLVGDFRPWDERADRGPLLEGWVFSELWKARPEDISLHFWRSSSQAEVDFVMASAKWIRGVEVKAQRLSRPRIARSSRSFIEAYAPDRFVIANLGLEHEETLGRTRLIWIRPERIVDTILDR